MVASCMELTSDLVSAFDRSGLAFAMLRGLLCLLLVGDRCALEVSIEDTLLCKCLKASYGLIPFLSDSSGGNVFSANSVGCGGNGSKPFGGKKAPGGGISPPGGRFVIAGGKGNNSAPGNTGGVANGGAPEDKRKRKLVFIDFGFFITILLCIRRRHQHDVI